MKTDRENQSASGSRAKYEPLSVSVMNVSPQGVLCGSASSSEGGLGLNIQSYSNGGTL